MVHVVGALISQLVAYVFDICARLYAKMTTTLAESGRRDNDIIGKLEETVKYSYENMRTLSEIEELSREIVQNIRQRHCAKIHHGNLFGADKNFRI